MALDWLYGSTIVHPNSARLRCYVWDPDTIREIHQAMLDETGHARIEFGVKESNLRTTFSPLTVEQFDAAADWQRRNLRIYGGPADEVQVSLPVRWMASVQVQAPRNPDGTEAASPYAELFEHFVKKVQNEGSPRIVWQRFVSLVPWVGLLALLGAWIWFAVDQQPPLSLLAFGSLLTAVTAVLAGQWSRQLHSRFAGQVPGNRVRRLSRLEVRNRRADARQNLKISAVTLPVGAFLAAIAIWLFHLY